MLRCDEWEIVDHVQSIEAVPLDVLPSGEARELLLTMARAGEDVSAYQAAGIDGPWNVWIGPLDQAGRRITAAEWVARWPAIVAEISEQAERRQGAHHA